MDKSWIDLQGKTADYVLGIDAFLEFAYGSRPNDSTICCPCEKCVNRYFKCRKDVRDHCLFNGFYKKYRIWTYHGESYAPTHKNQNEESGGENDESGVDIDVDSERDDTVGMVYEAMGMPHMLVGEGCDSQSMEHNLIGANEETLKFYHLIQDASQELYPKCEEFTKLSFIAQLLNLKVISGWTNNSFNSLLKLLKKAFPKGVNLPKDFDEANKITTTLGFTYETWDACPNNCMLFRGQDKDLEACEICGTSRYKDGGRKVAAKKMRYFPLKPRLQKLFMSSHTASHMRWHVEKRVTDGKCRHPADSLAWKDFDKKNTIFSSDSRNSD